MVVLKVLLLSILKLDTYTQSTQSCQTHGWDLTVRQVIWREWSPVWGATQIQVKGYNAAPLQYNMERTGVASCWELLEQLPASWDHCCNELGNGTEMLENNFIGDVCLYAIARFLCYNTIKLIPFGLAPWLTSVGSRYLIVPLHLYVPMPLRSVTYNPYTITLT